MITSLRNRIDPRFNLIIKGATGTFGIKTATTGLSFITTILLTRLLGASGYGVYSYAMAWIGLLTLPAVLGLDKLLVREVAASQAQSAWSLTNGLLVWSNRTVLSVSMGVALLVAGIATFIFNRSDTLLMYTFWVAVFLLPLNALNLIRQAMMEGLYHVVTGHLPDIIRSLVFVTLVGWTSLFLKQDLKVFWAMGMNVVATGIALFVGTHLLLKAIPQTVKSAKPSYQIQSWMHRILPMMLISSIQVVYVRTDMLMLGAMREPELVGIYSVVRQVTHLITFLIMAVNATLAPTISSLYAAGDMQGLQKIFTKSMRLMFVISLPLVGGFIIFGDWFLLIFGPEFIQGSPALAILSITQLFNVAIGSIGPLLMMSGHERIFAMNIGISAVLNIMLNGLLIPQWGMLGAATATAISRVIMSLFVLIWVYKKVKIHPTIFGAITLQRIK